MATTSNLGLKLTTGSDLVDPVADFSDNFKKLDVLGADYVVSKGTSGEWWWRKWKSGRAECGIDSKTFSSISTVGWGSMFITNDMQFPAYPFAFKSAPFVTILFRAEDGQGLGGIIHIRPNSTASELLTKPPKFAVVDATSSTYHNPKFGLFATGRYS